MMLKSIKVIVFCFIFLLIHFSFEFKFHPQAYQESWNLFKSIEKRSVRKKILTNEQDVSPIYEDELWPLSDLSNIGPISGISSSDDTLFIFHRADRIFHFSRFSNNINDIKQKGPIKEETVVMIGASNGSILESWGANRFYLPNGISIDHQGNVWLTDIVLNQVFKFKKNHWSTPELTLGQNFNNSSTLNFCMPTDVAISSKGKIYVSNGCNSGIMIFLPEGTLSNQITASDNFRMFQSITLLEKENLLCIADDGNKSILCYPVSDDYKTYTDDLIFVINDYRLNRIYAIDHIDDILFALVQTNDISESPKIQAFNVRSKKFLRSWSPRTGLISPHDICISKDSKSLFVCDLSLKAKKRIYKFTSKSKYKSSKIFNNFKSKSNSFLKKSLKLKKKQTSYKYNLSTNWPIADLSFGQIVAVDIDEKGNTVIFHRGSNVWNERSFSLNNYYNFINEGPINSSTVVTIDSSLLKIVNRWGENFFYLPHGLSFDQKGNVWLTDVAMHQVFKFPVSGSKTPLLTLGQKFEPGSDENHFCKPTSVAVEPNSGEFYVSDGYCNNRIIRFNSNGKFLNQWGQKDFPNSVPTSLSLSIPHKIILINEKIVCVADREHSRILGYSTPHGDFLFKIKLKEFGEKIFSISYSPKCGDVLFAVNGFTLNSDQKIRGFILNLTNYQIVNTFFPIQESFEKPHDLVVSKDCKTVFVVEIGPNYIWKFEREPEHMFISDVEKLNKNALNFETNSSKNNYSIIIPNLVSTFSTSLLLLIVILTILILVILAFILKCKKTSRSQTYFPLDHFKGLIRGFKTPIKDAKLNLGRLLADPKMSGFNRVALDESDEDTDSRSESEIEEFNVSSVKRI